jgi:hypothetical protein
MIIADATNPKIAERGRRPTITAWTGVSFTNAWTNFGGGYQQMEYRLNGDMVQLRGVITAGTLNMSAFTLPAGFRPPTTVQGIIRCGSSSTSAGLIDISSSSGDCRVDGSTNVAASILLEFSITA